MPKTLIGIFTSVAVILALCPDPGWSQQQYMTRGQLWVETFNVGHGAFRYEERKICGSLGLMYPGSSGGVGGGCVDENAFMDFWGIRQENDTAYNTSLAESFWILSKEENPVFAPETPADQRPVPRYQISMRGPSFGPPKGMGGGPLHVSYHMAREKDLGRETGRLHTYWPGTPYVDEFGKPTRNVFIANFSPGEYPTDGFAEEIRIRSFGNGIGLTGIARTMLWSYQDWDDFVIDEIIITNTSRDSIDVEGNMVFNPDGTIMPRASYAGTTFDEVYLVFENEFAVSEVGHSWIHRADYGDLHPRLADDHYRYTDAPNYDGPSEYAGRKVSYQWDGDLPLSFWNDEGEPFIFAVAQKSLVAEGLRTDGQLQAFQYMGFAPVVWMPPFVNDPEDYVAPQGDQPSIVHWWDFPDFPRNEIPRLPFISDEEGYNAIVNTSVPIRPNPTEIGRVAHAHVFGPYRLEPGQKLKLVVAFAGGTGAEFAGPGGEPMDIYEWARLGNQDQLKDGERALFAHIERAVTAYRAGYDLPDPPPDVEVAIGPSPEGTNRLTWNDDADDALDPDYTGSEAQDVAAYRVYRSTERHLGPWEMIKEIRVKESPYHDAGTYTYDDETSAAGFAYWYSVRSVDSGHQTWSNDDGSVTLADLPEIVQKHVKAGLESGKVSPEQRGVNNTLLSVSPVLPSSVERDQLAREVLVVPNPFKVEGGNPHNYKGSDKIRFVNIPRKARISIFSTFGDLIKVLEHDDPARGEVEWDQITLNRSGRISTGIYYYVVESLMPGEEGKKQTGTFVVIR